MSNWDVHIYRTRDRNWAARIGKWRSNEYALLTMLLSAIGTKVASDVFDAYREGDE